MTWLKGFTFPNLDYKGRPESGSTLERIEESTYSDDLSTIKSNDDYHVLIEGPPLTLVVYFNENNELSIVIAYVKKR